MPSTSTSAIAQTTTALKTLLQETLTKFASAAGLGDAAVTLMPPDRIATGEDEHSALNLFLYRLAPHGVLQGERSRLVLPPGAVAFDLFYLLTAYGAKDYHSELLLGYAVQALGAAPALDAAQLREMEATCGKKLSAEEKAQEALRRGPRLTPDMLTKSLKAATNKSLGKTEVSPHDLKIIPYFMSLDDMSKVWSSLQAKYRPSVAYQVTPIVIAP